jgi:Flp pilus assembly pilin Flp
MDQLNHLVREECGQTMSEYAVLLTVITVAIVASLALLSSSVTNVLNTVITLM